MSRINSKRVFKNHPISEISLENKIYYLNGLALMITIDGDIDPNEKEYLSVFINTLKLNKEYLNELIAFSQNPTEDEIQEILTAIKECDLSDVFLLDCLGIIDADGKKEAEEHALFNTYSTALEISAHQKADIFKLIELFKTRDLGEIFTFVENNTIERSRINYLLDYHRIYEDSDVEVIDYNGSDLFYTDRVTESEAQALGTFFQDDGVFNEDQKSIKLDRKGGVYQIKLVVDQPSVDNPAIVTFFTTVAQAISKNVFQDNPVDIFFCDDFFQTLKEIKYNYGKRLSYNRSDLFYNEGITVSQARALGDYFQKAEWFDEHPKSIKLDQGGGHYQIKFVIDQSVADDQGTIRAFEELAQSISQEVFQNKPVDIFLCDEAFQTLKEIKMK